MQSRPFFIFVKQCSWSLPTSFRVAFKVAFLTPVFTFLEFCPYPPPVVLLYLIATTVPWSLFKTFLKYIWGFFSYLAMQPKISFMFLWITTMSFFGFGTCPACTKYKALLQQWTFYPVILISVFISVHSYICGFTCKASWPEMGLLHKSSHYHPYSLSFYDVFKKWVLRLLLCYDSYILGKTRTELPNCILLSSVLILWM